MSERDHDVAEVKGTIILRDGTTSEFSIGTDFGWSQWGAVTERLGQTVGVIEGMIEGMKEAEVRFVSDYEDQESAEDDDVVDALIEQGLIEEVAPFTGYPRSYGTLGDSLQAKEDRDA